MDAETGFSVHASSAADQDGGDDGVAAFAPFPAGRWARFTTTVAVSEVDRTARLCGWVDFDLSGTFGSHRAGLRRRASRVHLRRAGVVRTSGGRGRSYVRLRIGSDAAEVAEPTGPSDGEIEDYRVSFVDPEPAARPI